ncbi:hypothetical protein ACFLT2_00225 [Acidobacteriota bacterium]
MKNQVKLNLNLASNPLRNRRLFFLLGLCLLVVFIGTSVLGGSIYIRYKSKRGDIAKELDAINRKLTMARSDEIRFGELIEQNLANYKETSDYINNVIYRKSFPWIEFFATMEDSLPESSYIISLTPVPVDGTEMEVRFQAVFSNLDELLKFVNTLDSKGFEDINIVSESQSTEGFLISEISVRYERNV